MSRLVLWNWVFYIPSFLFFILCIVRYFNPQGGVGYFIGRTTNWVGGFISPLFIAVTFILLGYRLGLEKSTNPLVPLKTLVINTLLLAAFAGSMITAGWLF